jgi:hypothetical protein
MMARGLGERADAVGERERFAKVGEGVVVFELAVVHEPPAPAQHTHVLGQVRSAQDAQLAPTRGARRCTG